MKMHDGERVPHEYRREVNGVSFVFQWYGCGEQPYNLWMPFVVLDIEG